MNSPRKTFTRLLRMARNIKSRVRSISPVWWLLSIIGVTVTTWAGHTIEKLINANLPPVEALTCQREADRPPLTSEQLVVLIAHPQGDDDYQVLAELQAALGELPGMKTYPLCKSIPFPRFSTQETAEKVANKEAEKLLRAYHADLIIWGRVIAAQKKVRLYATNSFGGCGHDTSHLIIDNEFQDSLSADTKEKLITTAINESMATCNSHDPYIALAFLPKIGQIQILLNAVSVHSPSSDSRHNLQVSLATAERNIALTLKDYMIENKKFDLREKIRAIVLDGINNEQSHQKEMTLRQSSHEIFAPNHELLGDLAGVAYQFYRDDNKSLASKKYASLAMEENLAAFKEYMFDERYARCFGAGKPVPDPPDDVWRVNDRLIHWIAIAEDFGTFDEPTMAFALNRLRRSYTKGDQASEEELVQNAVGIMHKSNNANVIGPAIKILRESPANPEFSNPPQVQTAIAEGVDKLSKNPSPSAVKAIKTP